jgi:superfamily II DNA or RNA helicase/HKD family nuclease
MTRIIDNSKEKLSAALRDEICDKTEVAVASAFFNVHGYGAIKDTLADKPLRFLLGAEPTQSVKWEEEILKELEEQEDDPTYFKLLADCIKYFNDDKRDIRLPEGAFFHGKAYIAANPSLATIRDGVGVVGSSNFTYGGLVANRELNMLNTDREAVQELSNWFQQNWDKAKPYKQDFLRLLSNYTTTHTPYEVAAKALYETYKNNLDESGNVTLKSLHYHQRLSYRDATQKLTTYGGVLIADSTGLGKSRVCIALALDAKKEERHLLLIAPKSVLETTWKDELDKMDFHIKCINSEMISSDPDILERDYPDADFIIIDEAHYFRNPSTNRYDALQKLILKNEAQVVLATATPVNNSLMDLYNLLALYLREDCVQDLCNKSLQSYFIEQEKRWNKDEPIDMEMVLRRFITRHSRDLAKALDPEGKIKFPDRVLDPDPRNRYEIGVDYERIDETLLSFKHPYYDLAVDLLWGESILPSGRQLTGDALRRQREALKQLIWALVHLNLFKRLESSTEAYRRTLEDLDAYIAGAVKYAEKEKYFVPPALKSDLKLLLEDDFDEDDIDNRLPAPEELFAKAKYKGLLPRFKLNDKQVRDFKSACNRDRALIRTLLDMIPKKDEKYTHFADRIQDLVADIPRGSGNGLLVFTQYAATAEYIHTKLLKEKLDLPVMLTTGSKCIDATGKGSKKTDIIRFFQKNGGILISTDVLSAGQNLQNAQNVANYDFPWNPVVLIQRIGRVDRMGSFFDHVNVLNVLPRNGDPDDPKSLEHFLKLMTRIAHRLEVIRETIGLDATTLGEEATSKDFSIQLALARNDPGILKALTMELEQFTSSAMDTLAEIMNKEGLNWLKTIPNGIGAYKDGEKQQLFVLFRDSDDLHWRMKNIDDKTYNNSPTEIVKLLVAPPNDEAGTPIDYQPLVHHMRQMKQELKKELQDAQARVITTRGVPVSKSRNAVVIYEELCKIKPEGETLAAIYREQSNSQSLTRTLIKAVRQNNLDEVAHKVLKPQTSTPPPAPREIKPKRVCWCWIGPKN